MHIVYPELSTAPIELILVISHTTAMTYKRVKCLLHCDSLILHANQPSFQQFLSINEYDLKFKTKSVAKGDPIF